MHDMIGTLLREIKAVDTPANRTDYQRFFKEKLEHPVFRMAFSAAVLFMYSLSTFVESSLAWNIQILFLFTATNMLQPLSCAVVTMCAVGSTSMYATPLGATQGK